MKNVAVVLPFRCIFIAGNKWQIGTDEPVLCVKGVALNLPALPYANRAVV
jgi:hypothetical protein